MQQAQAIEIVAYLANNSEDSDNSSSTTSESVIGIAVKNGSSTWTVILHNEQQITVTSDDLMDPSWFYVKQQCLNDDQNLQERKKQSAKMKRARMLEKLQKEEMLHEKAMEELRKFERKEFDNIVTIMQSGSEYRFEDFLEMVDRIRKPFTCFIDGHEVSITQDDSAIMMEKSIMKEIGEALFHGQKRHNTPADEEQARRKRQRQGNQAVHTEKGATNITALHQTTKRDKCQNQVAMKKQIDGLKHALKIIETILSALTIRKNRNPQSYWTADQSTSQADLILLLRIFAPDCGLFTKRKNEQWKYVEEQLLQILSKAAVDAKEEQFTRHRAVLQEQLQEAEREPLPAEEDDGLGQDPEFSGGVHNEEQDTEP